MLEARITHVEKNGSDLLLKVKPLARGDIDVSRQIVIRNFTHLPQVGQSLWGTSNRVIIEPGMGIMHRQFYIHHNNFELLEGQPS